MRKVNDTPKQTSTGNSYGILTSSSINHKYDFNGNFDSLILKYVTAGNSLILGS